MSGDLIFAFFNQFIATSCSTLYFLFTIFIPLCDDDDDNGKKEA